MSLEPKLWKVGEAGPQAISPESVDLESNLEDWLTKDISLLSDRLLVIGRQTSLEAGWLDLLAVDQDGNLVLIELKRGRTPREVVAQALDYAACLKEFDREDIEKCANEYLGKTFEDEFTRVFDQEMPEVINERQRIYIVASSIDPATQRIVDFLSSTYGVDMNVVTFAYFKVEEGAFIARTMLLDESDVERRAAVRTGSKKSSRTDVELREEAIRRGVQDLWDLVVDGFSSLSVPTKKKRSYSTMFFQVAIDSGLGAIFSFFPELSSNEKGLATTVVFENLTRAFGIPTEQLMKLCGDPVPEPFHGSYSKIDNCFYLSREQLERLLDLLQKDPAISAN